MGLTNGSPSAYDDFVGRFNLNTRRKRIWQIGFDAEVWGRREAASSAPSASSARAPVKEAAPAREDKDAAPARPANGKRGETLG